MEDLPWTNDKCARISNASARTDASYDESQARDSKDLIATAMVVISQRTTTLFLRYASAKATAAVLTSPLSNASVPRAAARALANRPHAVADFSASGTSFSIVYGKSSFSVSIRRALAMSSSDELLGG